MVGNRSFTFFLTAGGCTAFTAILGLKKEKKDVQTIISPFIQDIVHFCS